MNYTQNYQLCLWDEDDRILMEDFNGDNQKLETALASLAAADTAEQQTRAAQDAAIRQEFAAADTALGQQISTAAAAVPIVKLMDYSVPANVSRVSIDMSQIDLAQYAEVRVLPILAASTVQFYACCNGAGTAGYDAPNFLSELRVDDELGYCKSCIRMMGFGPKLECICENIYQGSTEYVITNLSPSAVQTLDFVLPSGNFLSGSHVVFWGWKL